MVQGEDARLTVTLHHATVVRVHEDADEEGGEESEEGYQAQRGEWSRSSMRPVPHGTEGSAMAG
jgi:hypothetical protein